MPGVVHQIELAALEQRDDVEEIGGSAPGLTEPQLVGRTEAKNDLDAAGTEQLRDGFCLGTRVLQRIVRVADHERLEPVPRNPSATRGL